MSTNFHSPSSVVLQRWVEIHEGWGSVVAFGIQRGRRI